MKKRMWTPEVIGEVWKRIGGGLEEDWRRIGVDWRGIGGGLEED